MRPPIALAAALLMGACGFSLGPPPQPALRATEQESFWRRLTQLCGKAYEGRMVEGADSTFVRNRLLIHVRDCRDDQVSIAFRIGPDPSRSWVVRKIPGALALRHDVAGDSVTGYGGYTRLPGTPALQEFAADSFTARTLPPAARNVWSMEIVPGRTLTYGVARAGVRRRFRLQFDLSRPVEPPAAQ